MKRALITGVTGQDGAYLLRLLLASGYEVHAVKRRTSTFSTSRIDEIYNDPRIHEKTFLAHYGDLHDGLGLMRIIHKVQPDEVYNLAAQSHVQVSFENPAATVLDNIAGTIHLLEALRSLNKPCRFYQASSSEMFGSTPPPQTEQSAFRPRSPYACSKVFCHQQVVNYREAYGLHLSNGILFNHESPLRGETFVTRKITRAVGRIKMGLQESLTLGNMDAARDWGFAGNTSRRCGSCSSSHSRMTTSSPPARCTPCGSSATWRSPRPGCGTRTMFEPTRATSGRRGGRAAGRCIEGGREAGMAAEDCLPRSRGDDGGSRPEARIGGEETGAVHLALLSERPITAVAGACALAGNERRVECRSL